MRSERDMCSRSPQVHPAKCQQNGEWHFDPRLGDLTRTARASHLEKRCNGARFASISSSACISARYGSPHYASPSRAADLSRAFVADLFTGASDSAKASALSLFSHHLCETPHAARTSRLGGRDGSCNFQVLKVTRRYRDQVQHGRHQAHRNCIGRVLEFQQRMIHDSQESFPSVKFSTTCCCLKNLDAK